METRADAHVVGAIFVHEDEHNVADAIEQAHDTHPAEGLAVRCHK